MVCVLKGTDVSAASLQSNTEYGDDPETLFFFFRYTWWRSCINIYKSTCFILWPQFFCFFYFYPQDLSGGSTCVMWSAIWTKRHSHSLRVVIFEKKKKKNHWHNIICNMVIYNCSCSHVYVYYYNVICIVTRQKLFLSSLSLFHSRDNRMSQEVKLASMVKSAKKIKKKTNVQLLILESFRSFLSLFFFFFVSTVLKFTVKKIMNDWTWIIVMWQTVLNLNSLSLWAARLIVAEKKNKIKIIYSFKR